MTCRQIRWSWAFRREKSAKCAKQPAAVSWAGSPTKEPVRMPAEPRTPPKHTAGQAMIVSGTSHPRLTHEICDLLELQPTPALVTQFKNEETRVQIEENVRGADVFVVQSMCTPIDHHI